MKLLIAGDFVPRRRTAEQIEKGDFGCLEEVKPIIQAVDYAIVNFESPVVIREAKPIAKTGPNLKCTERAMECIAQAGFQCVTLANNHFRDFGQVGVEDTIDACEKYQVDNVGGGKNLEEAVQPLYKTIDNRTIAIINCCEHEWSVATEKHGGANPLDIVGISRQIKAAKQHAEFILLVIHGGIERFPLPTTRMKETYRFFIEQGADAVVNHHQHCYSGFEEYLGKPIFYGLGNFSFDKVSAKNDKLWEEGFMVEINFDNTISYKIYPYIQAQEKDARVLPLSETNVFFSAIKELNNIIEDDARLREAFITMVQQKDYINDLLIPYNSTVLRALAKRHFIQSFTSKNRIIRLAAYVQCESHREIVLNKLYNSIENE